jgi:hypothetical protein
MNGPWSNAHNSIAQKLLNGGCYLYIMSSFYTLNMLSDEQNASSDVINFPVGEIVRHFNSNIELIFRQLEKLIKL